jgi:hypothetical protein
MRTSRALLILPFLVPFAFHVLYQPINAAWTVKRFGCGCPILGHEDEFHFNANHFNLILWCAVATVCGLSWWFLVRASFVDRKSQPNLAAQSIGLGVLLCICISRLAREGWL